MTATAARVPKILIVDDEESIRFILQETFEAEGFPVRVARDGQEALDLVRQERPDIVLSDIRMPGMTGIELLGEVKKFDPRVEFVIMTSHASLETSLEAIRSGAYDYVLKPFQDLGSVLQMIRRATERIRLVEENEKLIRDLKAANGQLSESNELLAARAATIATLLDYSQGISAIMSPQQFAAETVRASTKLASGRTCVFFRVNRSPLELIPVACSGVETAALRTIPAPASATTEKAFRAWVEELRGGELARLVGKTSTATYLHAVPVGEQVSHVVAVFETGGPFPPSVRNVLDRFMHQVRLTAENIAMHESMRALAIRDGLTGLYNHRYFQDRMIEEFARAKRHRHPLSLLFIDIDHFKKLNDTYGHPKGDAILRTMARLIRGSGRQSDIATRGSPDAAGNVTELYGRESDIAARYGGEEFVVILTETQLEGAKVRGERLRQTVENYKFAFEGEKPLSATISVGIASLDFDRHTAASELILDADQAVYRAKNGGRNRVCVAGDPPDAASAGGST